MSIYTLVFAGLTPIGSFLSGWTTELRGQAALGLGVIISLAFLAVLLLYRYHHHLWQGNEN